MSIFGDKLSLDGVELEALGVLADAVESCVGDIAGGDVCLIVAEFGNMSGFSAGCGAEVEDQFAGLGVEEHCCVLGCFILDAPESI